MDEILLAKRRTILETLINLVLFRLNYIHYNIKVCLYQSFYSHIDISHLRTQLFEYLRLQKNKNNLQIYYKIIINKILSILKTPNLICNHINTNLESYTLVLDMDETLIYYDGDKVHQRPFLLTFLK